VKECPACKAELKGNFPVEIKAPVQYGERIKAVGMYLHHQHFIPEDRLKQALGDLFNCPMATGTITKRTFEKGHRWCDVLMPIVVTSDESYQYK
jgi:transposase